MVRLTLSCVTALVLGVLSLSAEPAPKDKPSAGVRVIDLKDLQRPFPQGTVHKPTIISSAEELSKAFPEKAVAERLAKEVHFNNEKLLFFAWSGSGGDALTFQADKDNKIVKFLYTRGHTKDLRSHYYLFALPKTAEWSVENRN